jgi:AAA family ATP:ADP antiporter
VDIGYAYYVWFGIFNVMITAQFWAFAADSYNVKSGKRLFPVIMVGATLGGLATPYLSGILFPTLGPWNLMLVAVALLAMTLPCVALARSAVPPGSRSHGSLPQAKMHGGAMGGFSLVFTDRYLFYLALLIMLLNWVNSTGEYILAELVVQHADALVAADTQLLKADFIAVFYGNFYTTVNFLALLVQVFLVARIIRWIGVRGAVLILPVIAVIGYGLVFFIPIFSIIRIVKIIENSTDYSLMNTTRHALYLPLSAAKKYEGKTAIEAFFWRFGDLVQAGMIYAGLNWFNFDIAHFAMGNVILSLVWLFVAWQVARHYGERQQVVSENQAPRLYKSPDSRDLQAGQPFDFELPADTFVDPDEGDVMIFTARLESGENLPDWLVFDSESLRFRGRAPADLDRETVVVLRATDFDGAWAEGKLIFKPASE